MVGIVVKITNYVLIGVICFVYIHTYYVCNTHIVTLSLKENIDAHKLFKVSRLKMFIVPVAISSRVS